MKYAVISDIHGNYPALLACVNDAFAQGVSRFLYLGDYYMDLPYPNETTELIRRTSYAAVRGNKEDYFNDYNPDRSAWEHNQLNSLYWNYETLTKENFRYLNSLPQKYKFGQVHMYHNASACLKTVTSLRFGSGRFYYKMKAKPFIHEEFLDFMDHRFSEDPDLTDRLETMNNGVYLFGHTHLQWHWRYKDKLLLNPGSCGLPLDFDPRAAYSILEDSGGKWLAEERRVPYDIAKTVEDLKKSGLYRAAPEFSGVIIQQLETSEERVSFLIGEAQKAAETYGENSQPFSNRAWAEGCKAYYEEKPWNKI